MRHTRVARNGLAGRRIVCLLAAVAEPGSAYIARIAKSIFGEEHRSGQTWWEEGVRGVSAVGVRR